MSIAFGGPVRALIHKNLKPLKLEDQFRDPWGFGLKKDSELSGIFQHALIGLQESGLLHQLKRKWLPPRLEDPMGNQAAALGYENLSLPFIGLGVAITLVFGIVLCEVLVMHFPKPRRINKEHA